jgi:ATP-dependent helicase/nuclease subunit B
MSTGIQEVWSNMGALYEAFHKSLAEDGFSTPGHLLRNLASNFPPEAVENFDGVYAIGFYQLSPAERKILLNTGNIRFFWNALNEEEAAALDVQHPEQAFIDAHPDMSEIVIQAPVHKTIQIIKSAGKMRQLQALSNMIGSSQDAGTDHTAVLLAEQGMLLPMLQVMPENIEKLNVSMGLSILDTSIYSLIQRFNMVHEAWSKNGYISRNTVVLFFEHDLLAQYKSEVPANSLQRDGPLFWHFDREWQEIPEHWRNLLSPCQSQEDLLERCIALLEKVYPATQQELDRAAIYFLFRQLKQLRAVLETTVEDWTPQFFRNLLRRILQHSRMTLLGEPLQGLQVLGSFEMANLGFEKLFVLQANEGSLPAVSHQRIIPHTLTGQYKLPGIQQQVQVQEYLFWSVLSLVSEAVIMYNTSVEDVGSSEPSRWVQRLELGLHPNHWIIENSMLSMPGAQSIVNRISLTDKAQIQHAIQGWMQRKISYSALNTWLTCKLRFFLSHVMQYRETKEESDSPDAGNFGTIVHNTLEKLYEPHIGREITRDDVLVLRKQAHSLADEVYCKEMRIPMQMLESGEHLLVKKAVHKAVDKMLEIDAHQAPFTLESLEDEWEFKLPFHEITANFYGKIDRFDQQGNNLRIVDYKTTDFNESKVQRAEYEKVWASDGKNHKEAFQTLFYAWLHQKQYPHLPVPQLHMYFSRNTNAQASTAVTFKDNIPALDKDLIADFENHLMAELEFMLSDDLEITQTAVRSNCIYCPYKVMCGR